MSEQEPAGEAIAEDEEGFEAPERGSAEELFDARRDRRARPDAPLGGARHGRGGPGPVPGHEARASARPSTTASTTTSSCPPVHARRPRGDRGADAREHRRRPPVRLQREDAGRGPGLPRRAGPAVQGRDRRRPRAAVGARRHADAADHVLPAGPVHRPLPRPARRVAPARSARSSCWPSPAPTGAATRSARCSSASTAPPGRPRRSSTSTCGGARRRRSATTASSASQLDLFSFHDVSPGSAFWHPKGQLHLARRSRARCASSSCGAATRRSRTPILVNERLWQQSGHWDHYAENMFIVESEEPALQPQADELPGVDVHLPARKLRSYRDLPLRFNEYGRLHRNERSGALSGLTRVRQFIQDDAHIYVRPDQLADRDRGAARRGPRGLRLVRARAALRVRDQAGQGHRRPGAVGPRRGADPGGARPVRRALRRQAQGRHVLRAQDRHLHRRRARARVADGHHPGRPHDAARAVRPDLHRRGRPAAAPDRHPPRHLRLARAVHRHPRRALRRRVPALAGAGPGRRSSRSPTATSRPPTELAGLLRDRGLRVEVDDSSNRMQYKIRAAQEQKVPYMVVLGDREVEARTASPRTRAGEQQEPRGLGGLRRPARRRVRRPRPGGVTGRARCRVARPCAILRPRPGTGA